jgi:hypothetical protein
MVAVRLVCVASLPIEQTKVERQRKYFSSFNAFFEEEAELPSRENQKIIFPMARTQKISTSVQLGKKHTAALVDGMNPF